MRFFPENEEVFLLPGPAGSLEVMTTHPQVSLQNIFQVAIICHPHPLHQGSMHNKVVTTLSKAFSGLNMATVRFNFRGVGESEGEHGHSIGEIEDLKCVISWVQQVLPGADITLAGFSFGSFIAASCANDPSAKALVTIAPAVNHQNYTELTNIRCPWLVIMGEQDEIVPVAEVSAFVDNSLLSINYEIMPNVTHFFHGHLLELHQRVRDWIK